MHNFVKLNLIITIIIIINYSCIKTELENDLELVRKVQSSNMYSGRVTCANSLVPLVVVIKVEVVE